MVRKALDGKPLHAARTNKEKLKILKRKGENTVIKYGSKAKAKAKAINSKYNTKENRQKVKSKLWSILDNATKPTNTSNKKKHSVGKLSKRRR